MGKGSGGKAGTALAGRGTRKQGEASKDSLAVAGKELTYLEAIIAFALGIAVRHERLRILEIIGCVILFLGAWLVSRADRV